MKKPWKVLGLMGLVAAVVLALLPVAFGFSMAGFHVGALLFCGLGGLFLTII